MAFGDEISVIISVFTNWDILNVIMMGKDHISVMR